MVSVRCQRNKKIRHKKVKKFNNQMSPKGLQQLIENLNNKQKEVVKEIDFRSFLHLQAGMILGKLALWLNFNNFSCSLPLANGRIRLTEHDVHMTLGFAKGPLELCYLYRVAFKLRSMPSQFLALRGWTNDEIKSRAGQNLVLGFGRCCLEDTLDNTTVTEEKEEVNEEERCTKSIEDEAKAEYQIGVSKVKTLYQDGFLMEIDVIEKHFVGSRDTVHGFPQFTPPHFNLGLSQEEK
ncbi:LOW QUALITY PROTEIN: hypothetical protein Cgig2_016479 [Carnegiea gigantea]|uniref:Uncharacterized protein n=1 Tax=Carnegiea gigantea TaxID=171969 RepID=A0A9Q1GMG0_9CARY|nr:LOW QUALITY PROTEIN: hypothetical protein Cgig2_016479 [Carnegiea gigantea]